MLDPTEHLSPELKIQLNDILREPNIYLKALLLAECNGVGIKRKLEKYPEWFSNITFEENVFTHAKTGQEVIEYIAVSPAVGKSVSTITERKFRGEVKPARFRTLERQVLARFQLSGKGSDLALYSCETCQQKLSFTYMGNLQASGKYNCKACQAEASAATQRGKKRIQWSTATVNEWLTNQGIDSFVTCVGEEGRAKSRNKIFQFLVQGPVTEEITTTKDHIGKATVNHGHVEFLITKTSAHIKPHLNEGTTLKGLFSANALTTKIWQNRCDVIHGDGVYEILADPDERLSTSVPVPVLHARCGETWEIRLDDLINKATGCPHCFGFPGGIDNVKHGILYQYSLTDPTTGQKCTKLGITSCGTVGFKSVLSIPKVWDYVTFEQIDKAIRASRYAREENHTMQLEAAWLYREGRQAFLAEQHLLFKLTHKSYWYRDPGYELPVDQRWQVLSSGGNSELFQHMSVIDPQELLGHSTWTSLVKDPRSAPKLKFREGVDMNMFKRKMAGYTKRCATYDKTPTVYGNLNGIKQWRRP